jgi:hypothetical protein
MESKTRVWGWVTFAFVFFLAIGAWWIAAFKDATLIRTQFLFVEAILIGLCVTAGLMIHNRVDGILIDDRNRISLSRFQWVVWLVLILGCYFAEVIWNVTQNQAFPVIQTQLLALLGISSGTAVVSNVITENKKTTPPPPAVPTQAPTNTTTTPNARSTISSGPMTTASAPPPPPATHRAIGAMAANSEPKVASWRDLFLGDEEATYRTVDISRLQKLIITVLLAAVFVTCLWSELGKAAVGAGLKMPTFGDDTNGFLWLLGISHGAYLAQKATPKPA